MHVDQVDSVIGFAAHIKSALQKSRPSLPVPCPDVLPYTSILQYTLVGLTKPQKTNIKEAAVSLWNSCNATTNVENKLHQAEVAKIRAFAILLLANVVPANSKKYCATLLENTLIASRECFRVGLTDLAGSILECEAIAQSASNKYGETLGEDALEYRFLRVLLHFKRQRLDLADHAYAAVQGSISGLENVFVEKVVDVLYEIGRRCLAQNDRDGAAKWLGRAKGVLEQGEHESMFAGSELRMNVLHSYSQALLADLNSADTDHERQAPSRARQVVDQLYREYGAKLSITLLALEERLSHKQCNTDYALDELETIMKSAHIIDTNHCLIMHYLQQLSLLQPGRTASCFRFYVLHRLIPEGDMDRIEKGVVSYICMLSQQNFENEDVLIAAKDDLDTFRSAMRSCMSPLAAQAAHVLIWQMIRTAQEADQRSKAMLWCELGLHHIFEMAGEAAHGKLERQLVSYHLLVSNHGAARQLLDHMSFLQKSNKHSRFLAYCAALRSGNDVEAQSCLNTIMNGHGDHHELLIACVGESLQHGRVFDTARLLQRIIDSHIAAPKTDLDIGAVLKYTAELLIRSADALAPSQQLLDETLTRICAVFKHVARIHTSPTANGSANSAKIDTKWFSEKSFEVARVNTKSWPKRYLIDLLHYSRQLSSLDSNTILGLDLSDEQRTRSRDAAFMEAVLYAAEARLVSSTYTVEDLPQTLYDSRNKPKTSDCRLVLHEQVLRLYGNALKQHENQALTDEAEAEDSRSQLQTLVPLAFEALLLVGAHTYLSAESGFDEVSIRHFLETIGPMGIPAPTYACLADITLTFAGSHSETCSPLNGLQIPSLSAARILCQIIQALRTVKAYNLEQAARWIRCVAQLILDDIEGAVAKHNTAGPLLKCEHSLNMLDSLMKQVVELAQSSLDGMMMAVETQSGAKKRKLSETCTYPPEELEWLATKFFNMAIDFYALKQTDLAQRWANKSLGVAELLEPETSTSVAAAGGIADVLRTKMQQLGWR